MNKITFPGFGLEFNISQVMLEMGSIKIYWYGFFIITAFIIGFFIVKNNCKKYNIKIDDILEVFIIILISAVIGARLYYVLFNLDYYKNHLNEIFMINSGGLAIYGGIILSVCAIYIFTKIKKINFKEFLDLLVLALPIGQAIGRWGNFFNIEAYGSVTNSIFRMGILENGELIYVHPTFLYEFVGCMILFFILKNIDKNKKFSGQNVCTYLVGYGLLRFFVEDLRQDSLMFYNFKVSQVLSFILFLVFACILVVKFVNNKKNKNEKINIDKNS